MCIAAVGVEDRAGADQAAAVSQLDGVADEFGAHVRRHGVPDDFPVEQVDRGGQIQPALGGGQVGDVTDRPQARRRGGEVAADQVWGRRGLAVGLGQDRRRRRVIPARPRSRMTRSTRLRLIRSPRRRSSAVIRGDP